MTNQIVIMDQICCTMCVWSYGCIELHGWTLTRWIQLNFKNGIEDLKGHMELMVEIIHITWMRIYVHNFFYMDVVTHEWNEMNENNCKNKNVNIDEIGIMDDVNYHMNKNLTYGPKYTWMRINSINKNHMLRWFLCMMCACIIFHIS